MADPMTPERLAEIRERADGATTGPWTAEDLHVVAPERVHIADCEWLADSNDEWAEFERNTVFIAAVREDVPALLAEVERLRAERDRLAEQVERDRASIIRLAQSWARRGKGAVAAELLTEFEIDEGEILGEAGR